MVKHWKILSSYRCFDGSPWEKCTENLVEHMLKINTNVVRCRNDNAIAAPLRSQIFENFEKMKNFQENIENFRNFGISSEGRQEWRGMTRHSTSPPCGNLVDGLPHDCHTETVAKPGRLGPAQNGEPMQNFLELSRFCSMTLQKTQRKPCQLKHFRSMLYHFVRAPVWPA